MNLLTKSKKIINTLLIIFAIFKKYRGFFYVFSTILLALILFQYKNEYIPASAMFNGANSYVQIEGTSFRNLTKGSISLWFKPAKTITIGNLPQGLLVKNKSKPNDGDYWIGFSMLANDSSGQLEMSIQKAGRDATFVKSKIGEWSSTRWHHVVFTFDSHAGFMRIYIDGEKNNETASGCNLIGDNGEPLYIGANKGDLEGMHYFDGKIDEVKYYNRVLKDNEIKAIYKYFKPIWGLILDIDFNHNVIDHGGKNKSFNNGAIYSLDSPDK